MIQNQLILKTKGRITRDGADVKLKRILPIFTAYREIFEINPFLLLDEFKSEDKEDYKNGFPMHPHKGFQTITYMKWGAFEHKDSLNNTGIIEEGGIQWMVAGSGIFHSEMPIINLDNKIWGFQLWFNLPAKFKNIPAFYKNIHKNEIPLIKTEFFSIKILMGKFNSIQGFINPFWELLYLDISLNPHCYIELSTFRNNWNLIYNYENSIYFQTENSPTSIEEGELGILAEGNHIKIENRTEFLSSFLFLSSPKLEEPVVRYGPFVMNTKEEIEVALKEFYK